MDYRTKEIISNPSTIAQIPPQDKFYYKKITFTNSDRQIPSADTVFSFFQKVVLQWDVSKDTILCWQYEVAKLLNSRVIKTIYVGWPCPTYLALMLDNEKIGGSEISWLLTVKYIDLKGRERPTKDYKIDLSIEHLAYIKKRITI